MDYAAESKAVNRRWGQLKQKRESWIGPWQELTKFFTPEANPYLASTMQAGVSDTAGTKKHQHIYDNSPLGAVDVATAGLVSGMASPARPWFRIQTPDKDLNQVHNVRIWLSRVEDILRDVYSESNTYRTFRSHYESLLVIGTSASIQYPDFNDVVRHYPLSAGEYAISTDYRGKVDTLYRQFAMTADQAVGQFGLNQCSEKIRAAYQQGNYSLEFDILHAIEPRRERDPMKLGGINMPYKSCYLEVGNDTEGYLGVSGFKRFPALVPRWKVNGRSFYGESPARRAIGDAMQLQHEQYRKAQAIDFETQPALQVPSSLSDAIMKGPGAINTVDSITQGVKPLWEVSLNLANLLMDLQDVRRRIDKAMYVDVFLLFSRPGPGIQPKTAEEIAELSGEKLLMAGPILENLHDELLAPDIEMKFQYAMEAGIIPPPPPELHGKPLVIKFVSTLAQAQRLIGLNQVDRMLGTIVNLAAVKPNVLDKLDSDAVVDMYSDVLGVDPSMIVAGDKVALIRQQRAEAEQAQAQAQAAPVAAQAAKTLGDTNIVNANAAVRALSTLGGTP